MSTAPGNPYDSPVTSSPNTSPTMRNQSRTLTLRKIDPVTCGKLLGMLYVVIGVLVAGVMLLMMVAGMATQGVNGAATGLIGGGVMAILLPVFYGGMGFIGGVLMAFAYNFIASIIGGIRMEFDE